MTIPPVFIPYVSLLDYNRPLPLPPKRPREEVEGSTASETEDDVPKGDSAVEEASSSECERKRRKQTEEIIPRLV